MEVDEDELVSIEGSLDSEYDNDVIVDDLDKDGWEEIPLFFSWALCRM